MRRRQLSRFRLMATLGAITALVLLGAAPSPTLAQGEFQVIASGLDNPRGLAFAPDGTLYVAEAGRGGEAPCVQGPEGDEVCYGATGAVTRVRGGQQARIVTGMPSLAGEGGAAATGPHDIVVSGDSLYVVVGLGANPDARAGFGEAGASFGQLVRLNQGGERQGNVDVAAYEKTANPDGDVIDSNPYSLVVMGDRQFVVDAGGNSLLEVATNGGISTVATFPTREVASPPGIPNLPPRLPMHSVPNTVARGPDGAFYVGELTGFPFPVGGARVYRVMAGRAPEVYAEGFTNIIDLTFGPDGSLYVLEIVTKGLLQAEAENGDPSGALWRIAPNKSRSQVASAGLVTPTSVAIGPDRGIYVSNFGILAERGQVVRVGQAPAGRLPNTGEAGAPLVFAETGYSLEAEFRDFWQAHGGLAVFGYPIENARQVNGRTSQFLERARLELHPEHQAPYNVQLGHLGVEALKAQGRDWRSFAKADPSSPHYFAETGQAIAFEPFWAYWSSHGLEFDGQSGKSYAESLALFGLPLSAAQPERNSSGDVVLTQWFQRARIEYHPNNPDPFKVLIGRLGAEQHTLLSR